MKHLLRELKIVLMGERHHCHLVSLFALSMVVLGIFAVYAPSLRLTTFHDDAYNIQVLSTRSILSLFDLRPYGTQNYRPMSFIPWVLVRDWFGWFRPEMLHYLNVAVHVLNTALVASLAWRLGRVWRLSGLAFPVLAGLFFGLFPFSYQAVLWAGALPHPLMTVFGLGAVHAYLTTGRRVGRARGVLFALSGLLLLGACLSHEQGFVFGFLVVLVEGVMALHRRRRLHVGAFVLAALMLAYAVVYKLFFQTLWTDPNWSMLATDWQGIVTNNAYYAQGLIAWLLILLRNVIGLPEQKIPLLLGLLGLNVLVVLLLLLRHKRVSLGIVSLAWWSAAIAPSAMLLSQSYVSSSPRLMYAASIGVALLYSGLIGIVIRGLRSKVLKWGLLVFTAVLCAWCVPFVEDRLSETERLTSALRFIDNDLKSSPQGATILLINMPWWSAPTNPAFMFGMEGMLLFQEGQVSPSTMIASVGNTQRDTTHVYHEVSMKQGERFVYSIGGSLVNDLALRSQILKSNYIYRFDYDPPGLRVQRLAINLAGNTQSTSPLARFSKGDAGILLESAQAAVCSDHVVFDMAWNGVIAMQEPVAVFVHGMDGEGQQVVVADRDPVGGLLPLNEIPAGVQVNERRVIAITAGMPAMSQLQVGVYSRMDGQRYQAARADGSLWDAASVTIPVQPGRSSDVCKQ